MPTAQYLSLFLITKTPLDQFGVQPFAKEFLYFDILTLSPILNFGFLPLIYLPISAYMFDFYINRFHFNCHMITYL